MSGRQQTQASAAAADQSDIDHATDARLMALEVKASYADDLLDTLNEIVVRQQQQIDRLARELDALRQQQGEPGGTPRSLRDELPPHY